MLNEKLEANYFSNYRIIILTMVPLLAAFLNLYLQLKLETAFLKYASISSLIPLIVPFILRNYIKLSNNVDYEMLIFSNMVLLSAFIVTAFTSSSVKAFLLAAVSSESLALYLHFYLSAFADILLTSLSDKALAYCYKILTSLALLIAMIKLETAGFENSFLVYCIFVIPTTVIIGVTDRKHRLCGVLSMTVMYCAFVYLRMYIMNTNVEYVSHVSKYLEMIKGLIPFVNKT